MDLQGTNPPSSIRRYAVQARADFAESYADSVKANPERLTFALTEEGIKLYLTSYTGHADFALATDAVDLLYGVSATC